MTENAAERVRESVDRVYRSESRRILATLIRLLGVGPSGNETKSKIIVLTTLARSL